MAGGAQVPGRPPPGTKAGLSFCPQSCSGQSGPANALTRRIASRAEDAEHFLEATRFCGCFAGPLSSQEKRITSKIATGKEGAGKKLRGSPRSPVQEGLRSEEPPSALPWTAGVPAWASSRNLGLAFFGFISSPSSRLLFMAPGGGGERKEINIFLIKMQFYKYFFHLMLQELNITFLLLNLRLGCLLTGW